MFARIFHLDEVPIEYRSNFRHLYIEIAWFGVASGTAINFLNIFAARLGASGFQIGLIAGLSALVNLLLALPAGRWLASRETSRAIFWSSVLYRIGYFLWFPLPWIFSNEMQVWILILINFLMAIPLTPLSVGFNALFAEAVPLDWRAYVAGIRNVTLALTFVISSVMCGFLLKIIEFPLGYQVVFLIGAVASGLSSYHLFFIRSIEQGLNSTKKPAGARLPSPERPAPVKKRLFGRNLPGYLRLDIWRSPFRKVLLVLLAFHLAQYLAIPVFPLFSVNELRLSDDQIGISTALFYATVLIGSTQFGRLVKRSGHKNIAGLGAIGMAIYPFLMGFTTNVWQYYGLSLIGGWMWAMVGGAYANYMLERIPDYDRPPHLAWYNIALNSAILVGSLVGPLLADQLGVREALTTFGVLRFLAGAAIMIWG